MAKFATYEAMVEAAAKSYKAKAKSDALEAGLAPYAPAGKKLRGAIKKLYDTKVGRVAEKFDELWGAIWRDRMFE